MRIVSLDAFPIKLERDVAAGTGGAGLPTALAESGFEYFWSATYATLYSSKFETTLVRVRADDGAEGWGEAQAPLAPGVSALIVEELLRPAVVGEEFEPSPSRIAELYRRMYSTMRVRGQTGGFMLDAIAGVDIALWDLAGKAARRPAAELIAPGPLPGRLPAYVSGLTGDSNEARVEFARDKWAAGFRTYKLFYDRTREDLFDLIERLRGAFGDEIRIAVDALWRLGEEDAEAFGREVDRRGALWLECPLYPEDFDGHLRLARAIRTPLALGESYRTRYEARAYLESGVVGWWQPDLGRCGISESLELARMAAAAGAAVAPHVSTACGPQIAAALTLAAAVPNCNLVEYNPRVLEWANRFVDAPIRVGGAAYVVPSGPGLGLGAVRPPAPARAGIG